ncbi:hypothetical protein [Chitinophaga rhizosphaerae]|uniref:hypothetical protein n=1 Tax=Chitinophaga rhizosphaerae TaxID=1864947 RepID=UPI000F7FFC5A|nr:hypothetical protein [Chitinophaga rhizosphaerae]
MSRLEIVALQKDEIWPEGFAAQTQQVVKSIITWETSHQPAWYPMPGRSLFYPDCHTGALLKIKGAGFYNPETISFSGIKRATTPVPSGSHPMPPQERAFKRNIVHVDPADLPPFPMQSVQSHSAPIGGMTYRIAQNDQRIFKRLQQSGLPSNTPITAYQYAHLQLEGECMGVSVSRLPEGALQTTPFDLFMHWHLPVSGDDIPAWCKQYLSEEGFSLDRPDHRVVIISSLARHAGKLLRQFSTSARLYRFSGSPDNWSMRNDLLHPLFFSDVDTAAFLDDILPGRHGWEVLRNLVSAIHQWIYFFLPAVSWPESGYTFQMLRGADFIRNMLDGFFTEADPGRLTNAADHIWQLAAEAYNSAVGRQLPLRGGEAQFQLFHPRPAFYFAVMRILKTLVVSSALPAEFPSTDLSAKGIDLYTAASAGHPSHVAFYPDLSVEEMLSQMNHYASHGTVGH